MRDLVELLNDLNQGNRIEYSDYSQLMFCVEQLEEQIEKMKCCGNCSKRNQCEMNVIDSLHCDKWE